MPGFWKPSVLGTYALGQIALPDIAHLTPQAPVTFRLGSELMQFPSGRCSERCGEWGSRPMVGKVILVGTETQSMGGGGRRTRPAVPGRGTECAGAQSQQAVGRCGVCVWYNESSCLRVILVMSWKEGPRVDRALSLCFGSIITLTRSRPSLLMQIPTYHLG